MIYTSPLSRTIRLISLFLLVLPAHSEAHSLTLSKPPLDAERFSFVSIAGTHGTAHRWIESDGSRVSQDSVSLRGNTYAINQSILYGKDGMPMRFVVHGTSPQGDVSESFNLYKDVASWTSPVDSGSVPYSAPAFYYPQGGTYDSYAALLDALLAAPNRTLQLIPSGTATAEPIAEANIGEGRLAVKVVAWSISGLTPAPMPMWATNSSKFFAIIGELSYIPEEYKESRQILSQIQTAALALKSKALAASLMPTISGPVAFTNVQVYDAEKMRFLPNQTVIFEGRTITAAGPAQDVSIPYGTQCIDGSRRTLIPGLWDSHMHFGNDVDGPLLLSVGVTSIRDPGNDNQLTLDRIARITHGQLLGPTIYPSMMLDGQSKNTAQFATVITGASDALINVRSAKRLGFSSIKIYGSFKPAWLRATTREAHMLGLRVHGHIPAGMRPLEAIKDGFDEITHINFVLMQAMPDSIVKSSNGSKRIVDLGQVASSIDISRPPMVNLINTMAKRSIVVDPTLSAFEGMYVPDSGQIAPAYISYLDELPAITRRQLMMGSLASGRSYSRRKYRASFLKMVSLVKALHLRKISIVAGTDRTGLELVRELELYVAAGMTPAEALNTATLEPAKLLGVAQKTGSVRVGKIADLVLINGDPSIKISDLRNTHLIVKGGLLWQAGDLRRAAGLRTDPVTIDSYISACLPPSSPEARSVQEF